MREFDFTPLYRSAIGFDHVVDLMQSALLFEQDDRHPPYDITRTGEDTYRVTMAVAGFMPEELSITATSDELVVSGNKQGDDKAQYLHRGIATRAFKRRFELAPFIKVTGASLDNGLLSIDLRRELPEEMRPRRIAIADLGTSRRAIEQKAA